VKVQRSRAGVGPASGPTWCCCHLNVLCPAPRALRLEILDDAHIRAGARPHLGGDSSRSATFSTTILPPYTLLKMGHPLQSKPITSDASGRGDSSRSARGGRRWATSTKSHTAAMASGWDSPGRGGTKGAARGPGGPSAYLDLVALGQTLVAAIFSRLYAAVW
jgi:hypothetical protein